MIANIKLKNKNVLITGGAGFIGSNLCEYLVSCGANVTCLDNFSTGYRNNIESLLSYKNFTLIEGDIRDIITCQNACKEKEFVLHHAALGSVPRSIKDPSSSNEVNVSGFLNMLIASRDRKVKKFVFASSSSTYGDSEILPKVEDKIGIQLSPYAVTKYINELYADVFNKSYSLDFIGLRYFNIFGRRQDPNGPYAAVIPLFAKQLINYQSPVINGDGTYSRDFTYIDNVIQMNMLAMTSENKKALNQVYNTGVGQQTSLVELANYLKKYLAVFDSKINEIEVKYGPNRIGDVPHSLASIVKAERLLNYHPSHYIEEGLQKFVSYYWKNLKK